MLPPRIIPPVYLLASAGAMVALHHFLPLRHLLGWPWRWAGLALVVAGLALGAWAIGLFRSRNTTLRPGHSSTRLVTDGPFQFTRNPMGIKRG
jgi:protein-S-isoprenylcysteine O-methyltransferase Ste14